MLQFLVLVSGNDPQVKLTKDRLVQAGTLLEAFGNARTMRNDNASRFVMLFYVFILMLWLTVKFVSGKIFGH